MQRVMIIDVFGALSDWTMAAMSVTITSFSIAAIDKHRYIPMWSWVMMYTMFSAVSIFFVACSTAYVRAVRALKSAEKDFTTKAPTRLDTSITTWNMQAKMQSVMDTGHDPERFQRFMLAAVVYTVGMAYVVSLFVLTNESFRLEVDRGFRTFGPQSRAEKLYSALFWIGVAQFVAQVLWFMGQKIQLICVGCVGDTSSPSNDEEISCFSECSRACCHRAKD